MKTKKIRLLTTAIIMAAVTITSAIPASAQRRQTGNRNTEQRERKDNSNVRSAVKEKSTFKNYDSSRRNTGNSSVRKPQNSPQKSARPQVREDTRTKNPVQTPKNNPRVQSRERKVEQLQRRNDVRKSQPATNSVERREQQRTRSSVSKPRENVQNRRQTTRPRTSNEIQRSNRYDNSSRNSAGTRESNNSARANTRDGRRIYNLDRNDKRYSVNRNYNGNNTYWSGNFRADNRRYDMHDRRFYKNYDYRKYNHWNHEWEHYRWNVNSWVDYYSHYYPYSYRYHKYYYHHPVYGHVIRRFIHRPMVFYHNNHNYYSYDGHFFRFQRGVGYVLVDLPFGVVFDYLPHDYERVFINGYLYFRVGNLFFETTDFGFRLVHYPERYFAYQDDFHNDGYYFDDDFVDYY